MKLFHAPRLLTVIDRDPCGLLQRAQLEELFNLAPFLLSSKQRRGEKNHFCQEPQGEREPKRFCFLPLKTADLEMRLKVSHDPDQRLNSNWDQDESSKFDIELRKTKQTRQKWLSFLLLSSRRQLKSTSMEMQELSRELFFSSLAKLLCKATTYPYFFKVYADNIHMDIYSIFSSLKLQHLRCRLQSNLAPILILRGILFFLGGGGGGGGTFKIFTKKNFRHCRL